MEKIRFDNVTFRYPLGNTNALENVDFSIKPSEFVVVCGKSGCGKSTLLRHMKKNLSPYGDLTGRVLIDGVEIEELDDRKNAAEIGFVQQNPDNQLVTDKVWHELAFGLENLGVPNDVIKRQVAEMASYFGIQGWFRKNVAELSGGQKQLLNLASVMAMQPDVLILDEPASQLDPIAASDFLNTVYKINRDLGVTIVISEHRLEEVFPMADRVIVMDKGKILCDGAPKQVGKDLATLENGKAHPMYYGLPTVMKIFPETVFATHEGEDLPLTMREGRILVEKLIGTRESKDEFVRENPTNSDASVTGKNTVLSIKNGWFKYSREGNYVLRGVNLKLEQGKIHCLLGGNGSGKSTTLKALMDIVTLQKGKVVKADGLKLAMVPQNPQAVFTEITAEEEIFEAMTYMDIPIDEKIKRSEELLKLMEIEHLRKSNPYDLSGGEQQRLAVGKIMSLEPDILLLDEPTKGLDPFFKMTMGKIMQSLRDKGVTIFMVSHDIEFCAEYGDYCSMFFDGEIISTGSSKEFFTGNNFYTTTANLILKKHSKDVVTWKEAREWLSERV